MVLSLVFALLGGFNGLSIAQFVPPVSYSTVLKSPINPNITISYKSPEPGICTSAFESHGQKQYTGYVSLPPRTLEPYQQDYSVNTFFWFAEARKNPETAPLTIWLNGGPGSSSMIGLFREAGPCELVQKSDGSWETQARMWGWDRSSNIIFIDQPTQVGFSYDSLRNVTVNMTDTTVLDPPQAGPPQVPPYFYLNGTLSSGNLSSTQNTSFIAASASWHFLQGFLAAFPQYNPGTRPNSTAREPVGINLFAESYGGQYGPAFANYFEMQNAKRTTGEISRNSTLEIKLTSLGIVNGLVDELIQTPYWPMFAYNNTYGIKMIDQTTELNALSDYKAPGRCKELIEQCRNSSTSLDPQLEGDNISTNDICFKARRACLDLQDVFRESGRNVYDIRVKDPAFSSYGYLEYLNTAAVQSSIGAKVNFTESNYGIFDAFRMTGDEVRGTQLSSLASLLTLGVRVAFIYGDADYICNWYGGEAVSLAVGSQLPVYADAFPAAGYADIIVNSSYIGGQVRQYGNLSFSRIYDSGHMVPSHQPETAFTVFTRIIQGTDIGTGTHINLSTFSTKGDTTSAHTNKVPEQEEAVCWVRSMGATCTEDQYAQMRAGKGVVMNGVFYDKKSDYKPPSSEVSVGSQNGGKGSATSTVALTGVYTATGTPKATNGAAGRRVGAGWGVVVGCFVVGWVL
ncbi:alpha/beta-hydrolase [Delitschia confertaspora ATCC 74209]|uniref:Carboxypeptidase n=1 Tax=Delitschia confertaspora ATCC 74209 TaxID=1513339 RepID=A0A9P4JJJ2_9PLEO|nr:alpha/beta-hydrolase [Delitschia confertaspora ATCC 74209]